MISSTSFPDLFDWQPLQEDAIELSPDQIDRAIQRSQSSPDASLSQQWQRYLDALALVGFEQWLSDRAPDLLYQSHPFASTATPHNGIWNLRVGDFSVALLAVGSLTDEVVTISSNGQVDNASSNTALFGDRSTPPPQFFVLAEVLEEQALVRIHGYLRADELHHHQQAKPLTADAEGNYDLPLAWFTPDPDRLLLLLRALDAGAIATPQVSPATTAEITTSEITTTSAPSPTRSLTPSPTSPTLNVARWFQNQLDAIATELAWVLMPPTAATAMRWRNQEQQDITSALQNRGVEIPSTAVGAYSDLSPQDVPLRLHTLIWTFPQTQEWTLLIILGAQPGTLLPLGVRLRVRDEQQVLTEEILTPDKQDGYLYAQVIGAVGESFGITIELPDGTDVPLPMLTFQNEG